MHVQEIDALHYVYLSLPILLALPCLCLLFGLLPLSARTVRIQFTEQITVQ